MKKLSLYLAVVAIGVVMFGCKKDSTTTISKDDIIGKWMMTSMTVSPAMDGVTDMFGTRDACEKDDLTIFNADGTVINDAGATKCSSSDPQSTSGGTWTISSDNKTLTITNNGEAMSVTIVSLTSSKFVGKMTEVDGSVTYTITVTLVKK
jgi:hypothetical protein